MLASPSTRTQSHGTSVGYDRRHVEAGKVACGRNVNHKGQRVSEYGSQGEYTTLCIRICQIYREVFEYGVLVIEFHFATYIMKRKPDYYCNNLLLCIPIILYLKITGPQREFSQPIQFPTSFFLYYNIKPYFPHCFTSV